MSAPLLISIVRVHNQDRVRRLVEPARRAGWDVALWALDGELRSVQWPVVGSGPGAKFEIVARVLAEAWNGSTVVVADDDVAFRRSDVVRFERCARRASLEMAQPAHDRRGSNYSHPITRRVRGSRARLTTFVEIGPLFAVTGPWVERLLGRAAESGMGWGLEIDWFSHVRSGLRMGIVDSVPMRHLDPVAATYSRAEELANLERRLEAAGLSSIGQIQQTLNTWWIWQRHPPWL